MLTISDLELQIDREGHMSNLRDATCLHCHQTIRVKIDDDGNEGRWFHLMGFRRGCRSASSCNAKGHPDESLKGAWTAEPELGTDRPFTPPQIHEHLDPAVKHRTSLCVSA